MAISKIDPNSPKRQDYFLTLFKDNYLDTNAGTVYAFMISFLFQKFVNITLHKSFVPLLYPSLAGEVIKDPK